MKPTALEFASALPDDQVEEGDAIVRPGGQAVAMRIANILRNNGITASVPTLDYEHGWEFFVTGGKEKYWILVTDMRETKLLQTKDVSPFFRRIFRESGDYEKFLRNLYKIISNDHEFSSVEWFSYK